MGNFVATDTSSPQPQVQAQAHSPDPIHPPSTTPSTATATVAELEPCCPNQCYDLVVIGAGPHALALVARLLERRPHALISDAEHGRLHRLQSTRRGGAAAPRQGGSQRILVIDRYGAWMHRWDACFSAYQISHLRSPMFFHMDPADIDSLRAFAHAQGRCNELHDMTHIVDEGCSRSGCARSGNRGGAKSGRRPTNFNQRDREQFHSPSTRLFADFCASLVDRYNLYDMVVRGVCTGVDVVPSSSSSAPRFRVTYQCTESSCTHTVTLFAKSVVAAVGNNNMSRVPDFVRSIQGQYPASRICHASEFVDQCLDGGDSEEAAATESTRPESFADPGPDMASATATPNHDTTAALAHPSPPTLTRTLLIVGGGLTSAQMVDVALARGFTSVALILRSSIKIRQFDFSLDLMGRNAARWYARFWMESSPQARLRMIQEERNGGSITPEYARRLKELESGGRLVIYEKTTVEKCEWVPERLDATGVPQDGDVQGKRPEEMGGEWKVALSGPSATTLDVSHIWLATGVVYDFNKEPVFQNLVHKYPVETVNGLPVLTNDLQLHKDLPFFLMSGYSALALGPVAANIQGGRVGAERIATKLWEMWEGEEEGEEAGRRGATTQRESEGRKGRTATRLARPRARWTLADVAANQANYFSALVDEDS
ncbi:hypothetical protein M427DRAFT_198653 [Gonapodya prolifera JEL478]|uniref:L-ornithine N(5)-monooxygenase n=1 Tax=Gonapodya prolifera (strain JEL478) TaxID=1344416 RepID=A0A139AQF9_GONPJ|nr:hypothetical protein M427DRAFT_198653 [Gonapodya prolifera JEL478]|eukprot:KXS18743.1 hypothetical protein M427DRAFT_198653 [Gonapodya prolifera JEL478]